MQWYVHGLKSDNPPPLTIWRGYFFVLHVAMMLWLGRHHGWLVALIWFGLLLLGHIILRLEMRYHGN